MSVMNVADEHVADAKQKVIDARSIVGKIFAEQETMAGAKDFRSGYVRGLLLRLDDALLAFDGEI